MSFLDPVRLWLLVAVLALVVAYVVMQRRRRSYAVRFTNLALLDKVAPQRPDWRRHVAAVGFALALTALVTGFARPTHVSKVPRERATVMIAIDTSLSMAATDVTPSRIGAVQRAAESFIAKLPATLNVGLVTFHGNAVLAVPPTTDRNQIRTAIGRLTLGEGTAIGEAIFTALDALAGINASTPAGEALVPARIVLMSDGKTTVGRPNNDAVRASLTAEVPVSTIAFGTDAGTIMVPQEPGPIPVPVDRAALEDIAKATNGSFFSATTEGQLSKVYADIGSSVGYTDKDTELTSWFLGAAFVALVGAAAASLTWSARLL